MKVKQIKGRLETCVIFVIMPFLSIPFIFIQLKRGDTKMMGGLIASLLGMISANYIPSFSNDKARYIERFDQFYLYSYSDFIDYLKRIIRPDFIFDHFVFFFSKMEVNLNIFFFLCTAITFYSVFVFVIKVNEYYLSSFKLSISITLLVIFCFSLPNLFSGIRFTLAASIFIWVVYFFFIKRNFTKGVLLFVLTVFTHFSFSFFIPVILAVFYLPKKIDPKFLLGFSLIFLVLPKEFVTNIFEFLSLPESYSKKTNLYLTMDRQISNNAEILSFLNVLWLYFVSYFMLFLNKNRKDKFYLFIIISMAFVNVTYTMPEVFSRYSLFLKLVITVYFVIMFASNKIKPKYFYLFYSLSFIAFFISYFVSRDNFSATYVQSNFLTLWTIFSNEITELDFL